MKHNSCTSENSFALKKDEIKELQWELSVECPPTLAMLSSSLFSSMNFVENVRRVTNEDVEDLRSELMRELQKLERRIQDLRRI